MEKRFQYVYHVNWENGVIMINLITDFNLKHLFKLS